ncbi:hypothetical protein ES703_00030 [subsurface metagenome]
MVDGTIVGLERATLKKLSDGDRLVLMAELARVVSVHKEPFVVEMIARNAAKILALVEAVNDNSKQGYGGLSSDGHQLTVQWLTPEDFHVSGDDTQPHYSGWQRWMQAGSIETFIGGTTLEEEGLIIFGWADSVSEPIAAALKLYKGTEESVVEPLAWIRWFECCKAWDPIKATAASGVSSHWGAAGCTDWTQNAFYGGGSHVTPIVEMRRALLIPPETTWRVEVKYLTSGVDSLTPLGFRVRTATAAWNLAF